MRSTATEIHSSDNGATHRPIARRASAVLLAGALAVSAACSDSTAPNQANCDSFTTLQVGETVTGNLSTSDCRRSDGSYQDTWRFSLASTTQVQIDLTSNSFDTYLILNGADGSFILENDDFEEDGDDSRLITTLAAGTYHVIANSYFADRVGAYQLRVGVVTPP
jgi:hypothetical protein